MTESIVSEILDSARCYFHLRAFHEEVLSGENALKISFSFRAYAAALRDMCLTVLQKILAEENNAKKEGIDLTEEISLAENSLTLILLFYIQWQEERTLY